MKNKESQELNKLKQKVQSLLRSNSKSSLSELEKYGQLAQEYKNQEHIAEYYYTMGYVYSTESYFDKALQYYQLAEEENQKLDLHLENKLRIGYGSIYNQQGNYEEAIQSYIAAIETNTNEFLETVYNNLAVVFNQVGDLDNAVLYFEKAYELLVINGDFVDSIGILNNMGKIKIRQKNFGEAKKMLKKASKLAIEHKNVHQQIISERNIAELYYAEEDLEQSLLHLDKAHSLMNQYSPTKLHYSILILCAEINDKIRKYDLANQYYLAAYELSQETNSVDRLACLTKYYLFLEAQHDFKRALFFLKKLHEEMTFTNQQEKEKELNKARILFEDKEQKLKLEKLQEVNHLYAQLEKQSLELKKKKIKLENINNDLIHFSYALSHDLREPARLVNSYSDVLTMMLKNKLSSKEEKLFGSLKEGAQRMELLIDDLHKYSTLGTNEESKTNVDLTKIVAICQNMFDESIKQNDVIISVDELPIIKGYPTQMQQLFRNLFQNAIQYKKSNKALNIQIRYQKLDLFHEIKVIDNGIGIKAEDQKDIFRLFKKAMNHEIKEGNGVGLAFCEKILSNINGSIQVYSGGLNFGTEFTLLIPIQ